MAVAVTVVAATAVVVPAAGLEVEMAEATVGAVTVQAALVGAVVNQLQRLQLVQVPQEAAGRAVVLEAPAGLVDAAGERVAETALERGAYWAVVLVPFQVDTEAGLAATWAATLQRLWSR